MTTQERKEMQEMAQFVFENGEVIEANPFILGDKRKVSYVIRLDGELYYLTKTENEWTYFYHGGKWL